VAGAGCEGGAVNTPVPPGKSTFTKSVVPCFEDTMVRWHSQKRTAVYRCAQSQL